MVTKAVVLSNGTSFAQIGKAQKIFRTILRAKAVWPAAGFVDTELRCFQ